MEHKLPSNYIYPKHAFKCLWNFEDDKIKGYMYPFISPTYAYLPGSFPTGNPKHLLLLLSFIYGTLARYSWTVIWILPISHRKKGIFLLKDRRENIFIKDLSPKGQGPRPENSKTYSSIFPKRGNQSHELSYLSLSGMGMGHGNQQLNIVKNCHF